MQALEAWLPVFSWVKYPARKIIPRSGTPQVLPPIPNIPVNTRPVVPAITVTMSMKEPLLSTGQIGDSTNKSSKTEEDSKSESLLSTVIGESSQSDVQVADESAIETSDCAKPSTCAKIDDEKQTDDVVMTNESKTPPENADSDSIPPESPVENDNPVSENSEKSSEPTNSKSATADIEMKEENNGSGTEDKVVEEMQTSPKNPVVVQVLL